MILGKGSRNLQPAARGLQPEGCGAGEADHLEAAHCAKVAEGAGGDLLICAGDAQC